MAHLQVSRLSRSFDGMLAVNAVTFQVEQGETISIIGPNGAGKTTLFNMISGADRPTGGEVHLEGQSLAHLRTDQYAALGIARTFQQGRVFGNLSVLDNVLMGAHSLRHAARTRNPLQGIARELWQGLVNPTRTRNEEIRLRADAISVLALFGDRLLPRLDAPAYTLSYANRRRVEIARALLAQPRLLLLDEPTAGMNPTETAEMLEFIRGLKGGKMTILLIEHKLSLVMRLSDRVIVMDNGRIISEGKPEEVRSDPLVIEAYLGSHHTRDSRPVEETASGNATAQVQIREVAAQT